MKHLFLVFVAILLSPNAFSDDLNNKLLIEFHKLGVTHCDDFILKNSRTAGHWRFFLNKHLNGIDGPTTEVSMVQISGNGDNSYKTDYSFVQTLKGCYLHKKGQITVNQPCSEAVDGKTWRVQYNFPKNAYKRYKDAKGIILYSKEINPETCLLEFDYRSSGKHSVYIKRH